MIRMMAVAALALSAACGGAGAAPQDRPSPEQAGARPPGLTGGSVPNVFALLGARQQLSLTGPQVTELDSIGRVWSARNDSLQRQLGRPGERAEVALIRPILERVAANNQQANTAIEALLSAEQRRIVCTLPVAGAAEPRMPVADRPVNPNAGMGSVRSRRDTLPAMRMRRGWPWCSAAADADTAG
jgi:hypothetical protein